MAQDVFISYSAQDRSTAEKVCAALEENGIRCWMAPRDIVAGMDWDEAIFEAIGEGRLMVLVVSSHADRSPQIKREVACAVDKGVPMLPFRIEDVPLKALRYFLSTPQWLDASTSPLEKHLPHLAHTVKRLLRAKRRRAAAQPANPHRPKDVQPEAVAQVALLYKRHAQPDEQVLKHLETQLSAHGYRVFIDRHLAIGMEWAKEIERQVRSSYAVIPLLSAASVQSEMLAYEVEIAHGAAQQQNGEPHLLPVRVYYTDRLPEELARILDPLEYFLWEGPQDNRNLMTELIHALQNPSGPRAPLPGTTLEPPGGAVPVDSQFYVVRPTDDEFHVAIARQDSIVLVKGVRQMGKTSLLARGLQQARETGSRVVLTDFQKLNAAHLDSLETLYLTLGGMIADQLDLEVFPEETWNERRGPNVNFERYVRREVLGKLSSPLVWGMDEVDRLFTCNFAKEVFGLFRSWHNARALDPTGPWGRLTLAIAYATEAHLFITDLNQSPFNVGTRLALEDFSLKQVGDLNRRHGGPLRDEAEIARFFRLFAGQPYLVRRGLHEMVTHRLSIAALEDQADRDEGPFGDHLRRILSSSGKIKIFATQYVWCCEGAPVLTSGTSTACAVPECCPATVCVMLGPAAICMPAIWRATWYEQFRDPFLCIGRDVAPRCTVLCAA